MQLAQFPCDGDVAPSVAEADRRGEVERPLVAFSARRCLARRRGKTEPAIEEVVDQRVAFGWITAERVVPATRDSHQLAARHLGGCGQRPRVRLDLVVVAMNE